MGNKLLYLIVIVAILCGCTNTTKNDYTDSLVSMNISGDNITFRGIQTGTEISFCVDKVASKSIELEHNLSLSIPDALRSLNKANEIALLASKNNGDIIISLKIENRLDSTFIYRLPMNYIDRNSSNIIGQCAPLELRNSGSDFKVNQKKWLYKNNSNLPDTILNKFLGISQHLLKSNKDEYEVHIQIPVVSTFSGKNYTVSTDLIADNYILFAASNQKEIDDFVEEIVANDFELTSKKVGQMPCYRDLASGGYKCIFLLGINDNWSYTQIPLGIIGIDNFKPIRNNTPNVRNKSENVELNFKNNVRIILPPNVEDLNGCFSIDTGQFRGDDAQFKIVWSGDIESVSIKREVHRDYQRYFMRPETKTIKLSDKSSPYNFVYKLDLGIGDNYIPITVTDKRGNTYSFDLNIPMESVKDEPSVNIDNNVNVYN